MSHSVDSDRRYYAAAQEHFARKNSDDPPDIKWTAAVIGCGRSGSLFEHDKLRRHPCSLAGLFHFHEHFRIIAGCDRLAEKRARFSVDWGVPAAHVYHDFRKLFASVVPDMVAVATYTESHAEIVIAAARAGVKMILCEKPLALNTAQADNMIRVCREEGTLLAVHHERRWTNYYRTAKKLIESGEIGDVMTVIGNVLTGPPNPDWHSNPRVSGGGPTLHDGTHLFDIIPFLCGKIVSVKGETESKNPKLQVEDTARILMRLENGALVFAECGGRRKYFNFELDIQGTNGRIKIGNAGCELYTVAKSGRYEGFTEFKKRDFPELEDSEYFPFILNEIATAYDICQPSISSGEDGREALANVLKVYESREKLI